MKVERKLMETRFILWNYMVLKEWYYQYRVPTVCWFMLNDEPACIQRVSLSALLIPPASVTELYGYVILHVFKARSVIGICVAFMYPQEASVWFHLFSVSLSHTHHLSIQHTLRGIYHQLIYITPIHQG